MKIYELESKTRLDRATIRYYEKEGLINPVRQENGYRDYSEEDRNHLMKIKLLRQLGMSLEKIRNLQQGSEDFSAALSVQIRILERKIDSAQRARNICKEMLDDHVSYATLDAEAYIKKLSAMTPASTPGLSKTYHEPAVVEPYHPVRRFVARWIDYLFVRCLLLFVVIVVLRIRPVTSFVSNLISYGTPFLAVPLSALLLSRFGTTPGKWVMGLAVDGYNGGRLCFEDACSREWYALRYGYGFGLPIWSLIRMYKSYKQCGEKPMDWDYRSEYIYHPWKAGRKVTSVCSIIAGVLLIFMCVIDEAKPHYRGDLTVSEFASNYNDYLKDYSPNASDSEFLMDEGTWREENENVIVIGSKSEDRDFTYITEGETITEIHYENTWTDIFDCKPLGGKAQIAAVTMLMSQKHTSYWDLVELEELWSTIDSQKSGTVTLENIEIRWQIETVNCIGSTDGRYVEENQDLDSSLTLRYELIVH